MENLNIIHEPEKQRFVVCGRNGSCRLMENGALNMVHAYFSLKQREKGLLQLGEGSL